MTIEQITWWVMEISYSMRHCWVSCGNVFDLLGILVLLHRGQPISFPASWVSSWAIVGCVGFFIPRLPPFSGLFARFCVLTGTGNSTTTLCYCILYVEQNNCSFFWRQKNVAVSFLAFCGIQTTWEKLVLTFSRKLKVALMKLDIEWREGVILKQTNKQTNQD